MKNGLLYTVFAGSCSATNQAVAGSIIRLRIGSFCGYVIVDVTGSFVPKLMKINIARVQTKNFAGKTAISWQCVCEGSKTKLCIKIQNRSA